MITHTEGRVIVKVDKDGKNWHTFEDGTRLRLEREFNNLDRKHVSQVLGEVVSGDGIAEGALILFHHNAIHDVNKIFDHGILTKEEEIAGLEIYSFEERECFLWKEKGKEIWNPLKGFATALKVFTPYTGSLQGIPHEEIKGTLYITSGELNGKVVHTLKAVGLPIIFNNEDGRETTILMVRHFEDGSEPEREEITVISHTLTNMVKKSELYVGITAEDCKSINQYTYGKNLVSQKITAT
jgi:hypothetical protein